MQMKELEWSRGIQRAYNEGYIAGVLYAAEKMKEEVNKIQFVVQYNGYNNTPTITTSK